MIDSLTTKNVLRKRKLPVTFLSIAVVVISLLLLSSTSHVEFYHYLENITSRRSIYLRVSNKIKLKTSLLDEYNIVNERIPSRETSERLKLELSTTTNVNSTILKQSEEPILITHRAISGLGHRIGKLANAYHLVKAMNLTNGIFNSWGWECRGKKENSSETMDIFYYLFGDDFLSVKPPVDGPIHSPFLIELVKDIQDTWRNSTNTTTKERNDETQNIRLINDIPGYYVMNPRDIMTEYSLTTIRQKVQSNFELYHQLRALYRDNHVALDFIKRHDYQSHYVFGFHVRTGNGEKGDFQKKLRFMYILEPWIKRFSKMMLDYVSTEEYKILSKGKPPLLFVSTDTTKAATLLEYYLTNPNNTNSSGMNTTTTIPVVDFPQERMKEGAGVTYDAKFNSSEYCYQSWSDQFMDMTLLSASDVVIAGTYSAFTQSMPLTMMIGNPNPEDNKLFCELGRIATMMQCFTYYEQWLATHARKGRNNHSQPILIGEKNGSKHQFQSRQEMPIYDIWRGAPFMTKIFNIEREKMKGYLIPKY